ncbi:ABC-type nitrate/sulfonate/bicarbonate transport system, ATPase component [Desulfitobacterium dehalogenans ATCC 51507]|uniref:ABC-type nitrate/sulfonate/bicarbonate transport system, ATPase component n=2 Tax=Desulfitobacterium dehalogenans TaxID=36854 RepID=I4A5K0_DESDJ|nr:ABC-type nitrate/sulfonate/bicarbonate transport system, ATPase component [Desulfitobacterium dehalogenans ATCC 51507]
MVLMVENVYKEIDGKSVLEGISFNLQEGDFTCLTGPSGCGKTTLLRLAAGLTQPSGGRICLNGSRTGTKPDSGYVFQEGALFPWLTAAQNVAFGLNLRGVPPEETKQRVHDALEMVELKGFENYYPKELSGGMRMRAALARVLVYQPKLILMDEPFAALDSRTRNKLQSDMVDLWQRLRPTILMVTHNIDEAVYLGNKIIVLSGQPGRVVEEIEVTMERPRDRTERSFGLIRKHVLSLLGE